MQSTGEVIGHPRRSARGAGQGAARRRARPAAARARTGALALLSIADRDKGTLPRLAARARARPATGWRRRPARARRWPRPGYDARPVAKLGEAADEAAGEVPILELIASGEVRLVVNTPTPRSGAVRDAAEIRLAATGEGILCLTAIETAVAAAEALDPAIAAAAVGGPVAGRVGPEPGRAAGGRGRAAEPIAAGA